MASNRKKIAVAGASGLVGNAIYQEVARRDDFDSIALARRPPADLLGGAFASVDVSDRQACFDFAAANTGLTHFAYAALYEQQTLVSGWQSTDQLSVNVQMLKNILDALAAHCKNLRHITVIHGAKAYGTHVRSIKNPAREGRSESRDIPVFYWEQEDHLRQVCDEIGASWTILRPVNIFGKASGANNAVPAVGVYAAVMRELGHTRLDYTGGAPRIAQAIDADIIGRAVAWAGEADSAKNEIFNIANGDVYTWDNIWPTVTATLGMEPGDHVPQSLAEFMADKGPVWDRVREKYRLASPSMEEFVRTSFQVCDWFFRHGYTKPEVAILSTVKLHRAGFTEEIDTEDMFVKHFRWMQDQRFLPVYE